MDQHSAHERVLYESIMQQLTGLPVAAQHLLVPLTLELTDEEREGLSAPDKFRVDVTPYFASLMDPTDPNDPIRRQVIPLGAIQELRRGEAVTTMQRGRQEVHGPNGQIDVPARGLADRWPGRRRLRRRCA